MDLAVSANRTHQNVAVVVEYGDELTLHPELIYRLNVRLYAEAWRGDWQDGDQPMHDDQIPIRKMSLLNANSFANSDGRYYVNLVLGADDNPKFCVVAIMQDDWRLEAQCEIVHDSGTVNAHL